MKNDPKKRKRVLTDKLKHAITQRDDLSNKKRGSSRWITMLFDHYDKQVKKIQLELDSLNGNQ